jgi:hypothetical protein
MTCGRIQLPRGSGADAPTFLLNADQLGDQSFATRLTRGLQLALQVAFHGSYAGEHTQKAERTGEAGEAVCPGDKAGPVGA